LRQGAETLCFVFSETLLSDRRLPLPTPAPHRSRQKATIEAVSAIAPARSWIAGATTSPFD